MPKGKRKVVVITGASAGVGRATARAYAAQGARIGLLARGRVGLEATGLEVEARGGQALIVPTDVARAEQVEAAAEAVERAFGPIDVWINNAVSAVHARFEDITPEEYRRVTEVLYLGYVHGTRAALRRMKPRDHGSIVQVGSLLAYRGIPLQSAYCGAKHAIQGFTESLRAELLNERSKVRLTMVQLPALNTPHFSWVKTHTPYEPRPILPIYQPELAADAILWAAQQGGHEVLVTLNTEITAWGNKVLPGLGDAVLGVMGLASQKRRQRVPQGRPDNLWKPVERDMGTRGDFDAQSRERSLGWWMFKHRRLVLAGVTGALYAAWRLGAAAQDETQHL